MGGGWDLSPTKIFFSILYENGKSGDIIIPVVLLTFRLDPYQAVPELSRSNVRNLQPPKKNKIKLRVRRFLSQMPVVFQNNLKSLNKGSIFEGHCLENIFSKFILCNSYFGRSRDMLH